MHMQSTRKKANSHIFKKFQPIGPNNDWMILNNYEILIVI